MASPRETVLEQRDGAVLLLTLNRPRQRNAFNRQMWHELRDALVEAQNDPAVRAVIVTGAAGAFSAGRDLGEMTGSDDDPGFGAFMDRLCEFDKPPLAAVMATRGDQIHAARTREDHAFVERVGCAENLEAIMALRSELSRSLRRRSGTRRCRPREPCHFADLERQRSTE